MKAMVMGAVLVVACLVSPTAAWSVCSVPYVCADVAVSLKGVIIEDNVVIEWDTDSESSALGAYDVYRYDCENPSCLEYVTTVEPSGSCDTTEPYEIRDAPPAPVSQWSYQVRVMRADASEQCRVNTVPE